MNCRRCKEEYEPEYLECMGVRILLGQGYCPPCTQVVYAEQEAKEKAMYDARIEAIRYDCIGKSGIPPRFLTESFLSFDKGWQDNALASCQQYADSFPVDERPLDYPSLYLWAAGNAMNPSGNGTGKSHLSCAIALRIFERWNGEPLNQWTGDIGSCPRIYFVSEPDLLRQIQATYSFTKEEQQARDSEDDIIRRLISCDLLILDDVGKEPRRDMHFVRRILFGIISGRYDKKLPMIITANLNQTQLKSHLDEPPTEASFGRFWELIKGMSVNMDGESYRKRR